jgi:hypothetical protein
MKLKMIIGMLLISGMASASTLTCYGRVVSLQTGALERQDILVKDTNAVGFSAEGGSILIDDLKLEVYRHNDSNMTYLHIDKKNNSAITPYLNIATSDISNLVAGQTRLL